jgi:predicted CoA-binding protein
VSLYLPPQLGASLIPQIAQRQVKELWLNPGADGPEVASLAMKSRLNVVLGCSIVDIGVDPHHLTET